MKPIDLQDPTLCKRLTVKIDEFGRTEVAYQNGSDCGVASFAPDSTRVDEYVAQLRWEIFGNSTFTIDTIPEEFE